jgi:hypothetical protein
MAVLGMLASLGIGAAVILPAKASGNGLPIELMVMPVVTLALAIGLFLVGSAVMRHEGWARVVGIIYGVISLLGFPLGTLIGCYILWQLIHGWSEGDEPLAL